MTIGEVVKTAPPQVAKVFSVARRLTAMERLALAKLLLESILTGEPDDEADWSAMSLDSFQRDWDNAEDAIYDNWRELYGVPALGVLSNRDLLEVDRCLRRAMALVETALDDILAEVDLTTQPAATVQALAEKSVAAAVSYASAGKSGVDPDHLRELLSG